ncbi:hypothetical protein NIES267_74650 (plasmid) [Calothrix parasitica NIES-267]|uniref:Uncharacterized protein n=1 Tax=Calothrix parasitica NIES-267 TaxID=1973488 RepID=A0A1Z4M3I3_9CYAN|nr:hypothetical protein NIES267_74650 [Calothrix parasitica NIES-267]
MLLISIISLLIYRVLISLTQIYSSLALRVLNNYASQARVLAEAK